MARAAVYVRMKMYAESLQDREQAVQLDPKNPEVYVARGGSYHLLGQHEKGFEDRTRAIGLSPASPLGWTARGDAYFLLERWDEALADLDQAVKLDPKNAETRKLRDVAQSHVDEKIKQARAKELAPETGHVKLPAPVVEPTAVPVTPDPQPTVAVTAPVVPPAPERPAPPAVPAAPVRPPVPAITAPKAAKIITPPKQSDSVPPIPPPAGRVPHAEAPTPKPEPSLPAAPPPAAHVTTAAEYQQQARKLIQEERFAEAIEPLSQAVRLDPYLATAFNARGYANYRLKKLPQAIADFDQAIKLNPLYGNAYTNRSVAKRAAGDNTGADADQAKARSLLKANTK
jgi:tetratricopeptide (TPR) repeat protein